MAQLVLLAGHVDAMRSHVADEAPLEACGLVAGTCVKSAYVFAIHNEEASPTHFRMDARQLHKAFVEMERAGWYLLAIYHSHPSGPAGPSKIDLAEASYPDVVHIIWSPQTNGWNCQAFFLDGGNIIPTKFQVVNE